MSDWDAIAEALVEPDGTRYRPTTHLRFIEEEGRYLLEQRVLVLRQGGDFRNRRDWLAEWRRVELVKQ